MARIIDHFLPTDFKILIFFLYYSMSFFIESCNFCGQKFWALRAEKTSILLLAFLNKTNNFYACSCEFCMLAKLPLAFYFDSATQQFAQKTLLPGEKLLGFFEAQNFFQTPHFKNRKTSFPKSSYPRYSCRRRSSPERGLGKKTTAWDAMVCFAAHSHAPGCGESLDRDRDHNVASGCLCIDGE